MTHRPAAIDVFKIVGKNSIERARLRFSSERPTLTIDLVCFADSKSLLLRISEPLNALLVSFLS